MPNNDYLVKRARERCKRQQPGNYDTMLFTEMADALEAAEAKLESCDKALTSWMTRARQAEAKLVKAREVMQIVYAWLTDIERGGHHKDNPMPTALRAAIKEIDDVAT